MEDKQILALLWDRVESALDALAEKFGKRLHYTAMNILENPQDAEEAVNDTYMALWNTIPPKYPDPLVGYVLRTGRNIALNKYRHLTVKKRSTQYALSLDELADILPSTSMEEQLDARELGRGINSFLRTLSRENRVLFLRRYWFGDSIKYLSKTTGISENALSVRLNRIRKRLKDFLCKEGLFYEA